MNKTIKTLALTTAVIGLATVIKRVHTKDYGTLAGTTIISLNSAVLG